MYQKTKTTGNCNKITIPTYLVIKTRDPIIKNLHLNNKDKIEMKILLPASTELSKVIEINSIHHIYKKS